MTDLSRLTQDLATAQITERVTAAQRLRSPSRRRPHGRHALAGGSTGSPTGWTADPLDPLYSRPGRRAQTSVRSHLGFHRTDV